MRILTKSLMGVFVAASVVGTAGTSGEASSEIDGTSSSGGVSRPANHQ